MTAWRRLLRRWAGPDPDVQVISAALVHQHERRRIAEHRLDRAEAERDACRRALAVEAANIARMRNDHAAELARLTSRGAA